MALELEDVLLLGLAGYVGYRIATKRAAAPTTTATSSLARAVDPVVIAPTVVVDPYPDAFWPWGWGPTVYNYNFGRGRRGGHHHRGGGRRGRR